MGRRSAILWHMRAWAGHLIERVADLRRGGKLGGSLAKTCTKKHHTSRSSSTGTVPPDGRRDA